MIKRFLGMVADRFWKLRMPDVWAYSPEGLRLQARILDEEAEKLDGKRRDLYLGYTRFLRTLADKNWTAAENRQLIKEKVGGVFGICSQCGKLGKVAVYETAKFCISCHIIELEERAEERRI